MRRPNAEARSPKVTTGLPESRSVLECGDLSPLSPLADLSASEREFSAQFSAEETRALRSDGDKSPAKSGDKSPHSKTWRPFGARNVLRFNARSSRELHC